MNKAEKNRTFAAVNGDGCDGSQLLKGYVST